MHAEHDAGDNPVTANSDGWVLTVREGLFVSEQPDTSFLREQQRFTIPHRITTRLDFIRDFPQQTEGIDLNTMLNLSDRDFEQIVTAARNFNTTPSNEHHPTPQPTNTDHLEPLHTHPEGSGGSTWTPTLTSD